MWVLALYVSGKPHPEGEEAAAVRAWDGLGKGIVQSLSSPCTPLLRSPYSSSFYLRDAVADRCSPHCAFSGGVLPLCVYDSCLIQGGLELVFVAQLRPSSWSGSVGQLSVEQHLGEPGVLHSLDMPGPAEAMLCYACLYAY